MVVLGLLLLLASAGITVAVVLDNTDTVSVSVLGSSLSDLTLGELFLAGVAVGAVAVLALGLLLSAGRRKRQRRRTSKQEVRQVRTQKQRLEDENEALRARLGEPDATTVPPDAEVERTS